MGVRAKGRNGERAKQRRGESASLGASPLPALSWDTWDLYALPDISHMGPIRCRRAAVPRLRHKADPIGSATRPKPSRRYALSPCRPFAHSPFRNYGVAEGLASSFTGALGDETGVAVASGVADEIGVADTSGLADVCGVADDCGVTLATGVLEALAVALGKPVVGLGTALVFGATVAAGAGFVFCSSLSRRPVLRSELCLEIKIVRRRVIPKNIPPR